MGISTMQDATRSVKLKPQPRGSMAYLYSWGAVAVCGLAYVGVAATRPDLIGSILPLADQSGDQTYAGRAVADMADEIATLRKWVNDMQHDLAQTRNAMQEQNAQQQALLQRIAAAEDRISAPREVRADAQAKLLAQRVARAPQASGAAATVAATPQSTSAQPSAPAQVADVSNLKVINTTPTSPITTGTVSVQPPAAASQAPPAATPVAAQPKAPAGPRGIEIGAADSLDSLRERWGDLAGRNSDALGELAPRYKLATDGRQSPFTLVAGPFVTPADASRACTQLKARGIACRVGDYAGSAF